MRYLLCGSLLIAAMTAPASAAFIVDTGTPVGTSAANLHSTSASSFQQVAGSFVLATDDHVASIEGFIKADAAAILQISLFGTEIAAGNLILTDYIDATIGESWQGLFGLDSNLPAGTYWVTFKALFSPSGVIRMRLGPPSPLPNHAFLNGTTGGLWFETNGFSIGLRVGDGVTAAVPDVEAWALMVLGFGLTGAAMRRRRMRLAFA
jgi:hypothetical protein